MIKEKITLIEIANKLNGSKAKKLKFLLRSLFHRKDIIDLYNLFEKDSLMSIIKSQPEIYNKPFRSYLFCNIKIKSKFKHLKSHYEYISKTFNPKAINDIYNTFDVSLLDFELENIGKIDVKLCYIAALGKEGELTLLISLNNDDLYSIAFSFDENNSNLEFIIYGIQSRSSIDPELIKQVTKKMHGVRPRNFLFFILRQICEVLGIKTIKAIRSNYHVANCSHVKKTGKFQADYDQYWEEENGIKDDKFYTLPSKESRKTMEEIQSKKRSMYNKRYNMLDEQQIIIQNKVKKLLN